MKEKLAGITSKKHKKKTGDFLRWRITAAPTIVELITGGEIDIAGPIAMKKAEEIVASFKEISTK